ncbi:MAG: hypothetical protein JEY97_05645 [Bacteroidales bacterium]|nr:hypothetical protein [Bacteroidales bacterium]
MNRKFDNVQIDEDTIILFERIHHIGKFEVLYQIWQQGIYKADSIIFCNKDVEKMTEEEIIDMVKNDTVYKDGSSVSFVRSKSGYTFVNFNFQENEPDFPMPEKSYKKH